MRKLVMTLIAGILVGALVMSAIPSGAHPYSARSTGSRLKCLCYGE
jgi:hypothetical protein